MTQPAVPSAVSYEDVQEGNDLYRAFGQCTHSQSTGIGPARRRCICQPRDGAGARMGGMANRGERSINIVKSDKPKGLRGLNQNGNGVGTRRFPCLVRGNMTPGGQSVPHPLGCYSDGTWQPRTSPARDSPPQGAPMGVREGEAGKSEGHPGMGWSGGEPIATSPPVQAG